jgi:hypothetical protein
VVVVAALDVRLSDRVSQRFFLADGGRTLRMSRRFYATAVKTQRIGLRTAVQKRG